MPSKNTNTKKSTIKNVAPKPKAKSKAKKTPTTIAQKKAYPRKNDGNYLMNK